MASTRLLALGLDAADAPLLERWAGEGRLPELARLMARGSTVRLGDLPAFWSSAVWPSFATGISPAPLARPSS